MHVVKSWDNRKETKSKRLPTIKGRTWTRRIQWMGDSITTVIKLKFEDGEHYEEHGVLLGFAQIVYDRFRAGASIEDSVSVYGGMHVQPSRHVDNDKGAK